MQKVFKFDNNCQFTGYVVDSVQCQNCPHFFKSGTYTFIWCAHPDEPAAVPERKKPGRPKKEQTTTGKRKTGPNKGRKAKKR